MLFPRYRLLTEDLYHSDLGEYRTYGILVTALDCMDILHDVSICKKEVDYMVKALNRHKLSPIHLNDVVMDMLG